MPKITVTLSEDLLDFVDRHSQGSRSDYIKTLLAERFRQIQEAETIAALKEDVEDPVYRAEIATWDSVVGDGIDAEE
ncbi:MAG: CopG family transcriptional regulator [Oscillatoria sp. SIO1A7]|nr:CopG family transcriptional regulator [Oscillatoria sp. SIO1A7]